MDAIIALPCEIGVNCIVRRGKLWLVGLTVSMGANPTRGRGHVPALVWVGTVLFSIPLSVKNSRIIFHIACCIRPIISVVQYPLEQLNKSLQSSTATVRWDDCSCSCNQAQTWIYAHTVQWAVLFEEATRDIATLNLDLITLSRKRQHPRRLTGSAPAFYAETASEHYGSSSFSWLPVPLHYFQRGSWKYSQTAEVQKAGINSLDWSAEWWYHLSISWVGRQSASSRTGPVQE